MIVKLLTEHHLEFLSLKGGCTGSSESTHVKMSNCWKSHALAIILIINVQNYLRIGEDNIFIWIIKAQISFNISHSRFKIL